MLSLRVAARAARAAPRFAAGSAMLRTTVPVARSGMASSMPSLSSRVSYLPRLTSSFSTSSAIRAAPSMQASGETSTELTTKLESELEFENEMAKEEQTPVSVKEYLSNSPFKLVDVEGSQEVKLVRKLGDEKITIDFSVSEVPYDDSFGGEEENMYDDADEDVEESSAPSNNKKNNMQPAETDDADLADEEHADGDRPPVQFTITIEKPGKTGAVMAVDCTAQEGEIIIQYVNHYASADEAFATSADASHRRAQRYAGPNFATLDEDLQVLIENYLDERGASPGLAVFLPDYVEFKEQKEYMRWLKNVKSFVEA